MNPVVVDSSVAIKWFVQEVGTADACRILNEYQSGAIRLLAPDLIVAELGNIVWKKHQFQGLAIADAQQILSAVLQVAFTLTPAADLIGDAFHLAVTHGRTVYDSLYLALSLREQCPFVTADEKLAHAVGSQLPNLVLAADWP